MAVSSALIPSPANANVVTITVDCTGNPDPQMVAVSWADTIVVTSNTDDPNNGTGGCGFEYVDFKSSFPTGNTNPQAVTPRSSITVPPFTAFNNRRYIQVSFGSFSVQDNQWSQQHTVNLYVMPTVLFDANGGAGSLTAQSADTQTALTTNAGSISKSNFTFAGWNTAANGTGTAYTDGGQYDFSADITLFAQWTAGAPTPSTSPSSNTPTPSSSPSASSSPSSQSSVALAETSTTPVLPHTGSQTTVLLSIAGALAAVGTIVFPMSIWRRRSKK
ncbi:InlB B-repeat-containing protein [Aurantimicrobium minutum]|uniref:InlB B-repeat-containing protein n=1 Tax=Aurantimicrobium minutum TaxID=708131 RepID=UPI002474A2F7|nr:InlB B-repeat-containing protein [Aurantimicrobium minutum]